MDEPQNARSDQDLIAATLARDTAAFGELVSRYQNRLYHSLVHVVGSAEDAKDVAQEAFTLAFQKLSSFRGDAQFYSWLFRIALNASVNFRRKNRSLGQSIEATKERIGSEPTDVRADTAPNQPLEQNERQQIVREALAQMTEEYRIPLVMSSCRTVVVACPTMSVATSKASRIIAAWNCSQLTPRTSSPLFQVRHVV